MASLATVNNRLIDASSVADRAAAQSKELNPLRQLPNEDVFFYVKKIDNTRVVRAADPAEARDCWRSIFGTFMLAFLLTGLLLPGAYSVFAGYQIEALKTKQSALAQDMAALNLEEAKLLNPARLEALAQKQEFVKPTPDHVVYLNPKGDSLSASLK